MAIQKPTKEEQNLELLNEMQERELHWQDAQARREHELNLAKLKVKTVENRKVRERVLVALCKVPSLCILALWLPILILAGKEIPKPVSDFLNL